MNKVLQSLCILRPSLLQRPASPALYRPLHPTHFRPVASCRLISSNSDDRPGLEYEPIEDVEPLYRYQPGGYHPLAIGDQLHGGRYRIVHKLGHGGYSTAWLARDGQTQSLVAVKVSAAFSDHGEIETLSAINTNSGHSAGRSMVAPLLDSFDVQGPNGTHPCYVTTPAQSSLSDAREGTTTNMFPIDVARSLAAQVAIAIEYMHDQGFVHGDLHLGNILLQLPPGVDQLSDQELYEKYDPPEPEPVVSLNDKPLPPGVPSHYLVPIWLGKDGDALTLPESRIFISDYGETFRPSQEARHISNTPVEIRPPEAFFQPSRPLSFPADIWSMACTIWAIIAQKSLFYGFFSSQNYIIREQIDALGMIPPEWWHRWEAKGLWFTEAGKPIQEIPKRPKGYELPEDEPRLDRPTRSLEVRFEDTVQEPRRTEGMEPFGDEERDALFAMLRAMLSYYPESRITAKEVLQSEWMTRWALPAYEKMRAGQA